MIYKTQTYEMSNCRTHEDYLITDQIVSESESFYVQFYNTLQHKKYETTVNYKSLGLPGKMTEVYTVLGYCLDNKDPNYSFRIEIAEIDESIGASLGVLCEAKIGGILSMQFTLTLEETKVSDDAVICFKLNKLETELAETKSQLEDTIEELETMKTTVVRLLTVCEIPLYIFIGNCYKNIGPNWSMFTDTYHIEALSLVLTEPSPQWKVYWKKLNWFYKLKTLDIMLHHPDFADASSESLENLTIRQLPVNTFSWLGNFPNLRVLNTKPSGITPPDIVEYLPRCRRLTRLSVHTASTALVHYCTVHKITLD